MWPQNFLPGQERFFGIIRNKSLGKRCLQKSLRNQGTQSTTSGPAFFDICLDTFHPGQLFTITQNGFIMTDENLCLDAPQYEEMDSGVRFSSCSEQERQQWRVEGAGRIVHSLSGACLALPTAATSDQEIADAVCLCALRLIVARSSPARPRATARSWHRPGLAPPRASPRGPAAAGRVARARAGAQPRVARRGAAASG